MKRLKDRASKLVEQGRKRLKSYRSNKKAKHDTHADWKILNIDDVKYKTKLTVNFENRKQWTQPIPGEIISVMPGTIKKICITIGDKIKKGDLLLIINAMKMDNRLLSEEDGMVKKVYFKEGDPVKKNALLLVIEPITKG